MNTKNLLTDNELFDSLKELETPEYLVYKRLYDIESNIAHALVEFSIEKGWSQSRLAKELGCSQQMVSKYENGDYNFTIEALYDVCLKLGLDIKEVMFSNEEKRIDDEKEVFEIIAIWGDLNTDAYCCV